MFQYFPGNYVWNLSINLAIEMGASIGELDAICSPLTEVAAKGDDEGTTQFMQSFVDMGDRLLSMANEDIEHGRSLSAGEKLVRASTYFITAERMQGPHTPERAALYAKFLETFQKGVTLRKDNCEFVSIPYGDSYLSGLLVAAASGEKRHPCMVLINGLDVTKEILYGMRWAEAFSKRGISTLVLDQPGSGDALRQRKLTAFPESERWASPVVDWLSSRDDIDPSQIGLTGISMAGYYVPRAVAFEPRFALGIACGALYNWGEITQVRLRKEGERSVPHYWNHAQWVWNAKSVDDLLQISAQVALRDVLGHIRVPFLVTHGENDRQIPVAHAHATYDGLVNSPKRELKLYAELGTGREHCHADNFTNARDYMSDWASEVFASLKARTI